MIMNFKMVKLITVLIATTSLSGCNGYWKCGISSGSGGNQAGCEIGGAFSMQAQKFIRPVNTMLAETLGYTFTEWESANFNDFSIKLEGAGTSIGGNKVTVIIYDGSSVLGSKVFDVYRTNGEYKFTSQALVKQWAYNYIDIGNKVEIDFDVQNTTAGNVSLQAKHQNTIKASSSAYLSSPPSKDIPLSAEQ